jgi:hypothetical protein
MGCGCELWLRKNHGLLGIYGLARDGLMEREFDCCCNQAITLIDSGRWLNPALARGAPACPASVAGAVLPSNLGVEPFFPSPHTTRHRFEGVSILALDCAPPPLPAPFRVPFRCGWLTANVVTFRRVRARGVGRCTRACEWGRGRAGAGRGCRNSSPCSRIATFSSPAATWPTVFAERRRSASDPQPISRPHDGVQCVPTALALGRRGAIGQRWLGLHGAAV